MRNSIPQEDPSDTKTRERHRTYGVRSMLSACVRWFDSGHRTSEADRENAHADFSTDWVRVFPFFLLHLGCLGVIWVGISPAAVVVAALMYVLRMFAITGFYHRYFAHRTFETSRPMQFIFALSGLTAVQRGPLWWAAHHRHHHRHSDEEDDVHSPVRHGFLWSHIGWILTRANFATNTGTVRDLARYPELRFLNRFENIGPLLAAGSMVGLGFLLQYAWPSLNTGPWQMLVWGFFISTVVLFHGTCTINSLSHIFGSRRFKTKDHSRNNFLLALITMGEGWHNNHHHEPSCTRQGLRWWEIDMTYYLLVMLSWTGLIWNLRQPTRS